MKILQPSNTMQLVESDNAMQLCMSNDVISGLHLKNQSLVSLTTKHISIAESRISRVDMSQVIVEHFEVLDTEFIGCDFTISKLSDSSWHIVRITDTRMSGAQLHNARFKNVIFKNCKLDLTNFRFSNLENIQFEDCMLNEVDFYEAKLKNIEFVGCEISQANFASSRLQNVDMSQSHIEKIQGMHSLKGATLSYDQLLQFVPSFAAEAGIKIK